MGISQTQARDAIKWYHEFEFGNGLKARSTTPDTEHHRHIWKSIERHLETIDFSNKTVLDIGSWDGYWSFYAERRRGTEVLATDDHSQNWAAGEGALLAKKLLGSKVEINQAMSVYELGVPGVRWRSRLIWELLKASHAGVREKVRQFEPDARQVFMQCVPIEGENSTYYYCPPFALHQYDSRWISEASGL